jgi:hypothetical protein
MVVTTTALLRACAPEEAADLIAGLGLPCAPVADDAWFAARAPLEDEALLSLLLARVRACTGAADPRAAFAERHAALVCDAMDRAVRRLGAVPSLDDAQLRFGARGLPEALALSPDGWVTGSDRCALAELARWRIAAHLG